jgi:hypothetical protein
VFPEENTSGVDKFGNPLPPGTMHMSRKQRSRALLSLERRTLRHGYRKRDVAESA